jgi:alpha-galactosidase
MNLHTIASQHRLPLHDLLSDDPSYHFGDAGLSVESDIERRGDALVIRHRLHNRGAQPSAPVSNLHLLRLAFQHPGAHWELLCARGGTSEHHMPPQAYETRHLTDIRYFKINSHYAGRSSNQDLPLLIGLATDRQEGFFCGLEWSAHWSWEAWAKAGKFHLIGTIPVSGMVLAPGETLELPAVHLGFFRGDFGAGTNALRRYLVEQVCPPAKALVSYDSWFGLENNFAADIMKAQVDRAAELGVEVFVHDAAWFPGGFPAGVGNWETTDPQKWPDGLEPLAEYVRSKGMEFGLWFEIERGAPGTAAVREHPEFFIPAPPGWFVGKRAGQFHLNLARRDAQDWVIETMSRWITRLDLRWSRFDYNIEPDAYWRAVDPTMKIQFAYMAGLYRVLDVLMQRHPKWEVEACASGGRRIDLGTVRRAHTVWFSDETMSAAICRWMQARANRFLPGHLLNSSVAVPQRAGDAGFDETAILSRMLGKLAFDGDIASWSSAFTARAAAQVRRFKQVRHLFTQDFHQLLPLPYEPEQPDAVQFASRDGTEHAVFAFAGTEPVDLCLPLRGLVAGNSYTIAPGAPLAGSELRVSLPASTGGLWHLRGR